MCVCWCVHSAPHSCSLCPNLWGYCTAQCVGMMSSYRWKTKTALQAIPLTSLLITVTCADFPASSSPNIIFFFFWASFSPLLFSSSFVLCCHIYFYLMDWIISLSAHTPFLLSSSPPFTFLAIHPALQVLHIPPTFVVIIALPLFITCFLLFLEWQYSSSVAFTSKLSHTRKGKSFHFSCYFCSSLNMDSYFTDHALFLVMGGVHLAVSLRHLFQNI